MAMIQQYAESITIKKDYNGNLIAEIKMNDGVVENIQWTDVKARKQFYGCIKANTIFIDERAESYIKNNK